jgi:hypothetical protein
MKKVVVFIIFIFTCLVIETSFAQYGNTIRLGIFNTPANSNTLEIRVRPTQDIPLNPAGANYSAGIFTLRCPIAYGITAMNVSSTPFNYQAAVSGTGFFLADNYAYFCFSMETPYNVSWTANQEIVVATLQFTATSAGTNFELVQTNPLGSSFKYYQEVYGNDAQSDFYHPSTDSSLSLELLSFEAQKKGETTFLEWQTIKENNLSFYGIERSADGSHFETIGSEKAKNQDEKRTYSFIDEKPELGINYYRLKIVDNDGKTAYSKIITLEKAHILRGIKIYPNPATDILYVDNAEGKTVDIINPLGQVVLSVQNAHNSTINIQHLPNGIYIVWVGLEVLKFIKQ